MIKPQNHHKWTKRPWSSAKGPFEDKGGESIIDYHPRGDLRYAVLCLIQRSMYVLLHDGYIYIYICEYILALDHIISYCICLMTEDLCLEGAQLSVRKRWFGKGSRTTHVCHVPNIRILLMLVIGLICYDCRLMCLCACSLQTSGSSSVRERGFRNATP